MNEDDFAVTTAKLFDAGMGIADLDLLTYIERALVLDRDDLVALAVAAAHLQREAVKQLPADEVP